MSARLLFVFAKEPRPGDVKTRLCPPLTPEQAARCQRAFLSDLLARIKGTGGARLILCAAPDHDAPQLEDLAHRAGVDFAWQGFGDLGHRMSRALERSRSEGAAGVVIGADSPDLPRRYVEAAFEATERPGVVLGPSVDGGYYLVGCRGPVPDIFGAVPTWGTADVFARTMQAVRALGLAHQVLPVWDDVDDLGGLRRFVARLRGAGASGYANELPACAAVLESLAGEGVAL